MPCSPALLEQLTSLQAINACRLARHPQLLLARHKLALLQRD